MFGPVFRELDYSWAYSYAAAIREEIVVPNDEGWLAYKEDWLLTADEEFEKRALKPQKWTFLHVMINTYVECDLAYSVRKYDEVEEDLLYLIKMYNSSEPAELSKTDDISPEEYYSYKHKLLDTVIDQCLPKMTEEIFTLLFGDRELLRALGLLLSPFVQSLKKYDHPSLLRVDGIVQRNGYWPKWLESALLFRDRGKCAICLKDISGLLSSGRGQHLDHIVPLANGGTNDPTNLQNLCEDCNRVKGARASTTSRKYPFYW